MTRRTSHPSVDLDRVIDSAIIWLLPNGEFVERQNGTDRHRNARKARKTYRFSKDWRDHEAVTYLTMYAYNFCWPVRTLRIKDEQGCWRQRSPAMAAGLADHVWSIPEWLTFPAIRH